MCCNVSVMACKSLCPAVACVVLPFSSDSQWLCNNTVLTQHAVLFCGVACAVLCGSLCCVVCCAVLCWCGVCCVQVVVVVNKIDRPAARPDWVVDSTFELFMDLGATDEQCEFPVCYASGLNGISGKEGWGEGMYP